MKKEYIIPETKLAELEPNVMLAGSEIPGGDDGEEGDRAESPEFVFDEDMDDVGGSLWDLKWWAYSFP